MFNPSRLKIARQRRALGSRELAERAGISQVTLSRVEKGKHTPEAETIASLSKALCFPEKFFFGQDGDIQTETGVSFQSMRKLTTREKHAAIAASSLAYLVYDWVEERFNLPKNQLFDSSKQRAPAAAAEELREYWALGVQPISNIIKLLESKGIRVFSLVEEIPNVDAYSCWRKGEAYVFLNSQKTAEHNRFDCAHELGHLVLHKHGSGKGREAEQEANQFASSFLMPESDVRAKLPFSPSLATLVKAKKRWGVSVATLAYRLHQLGIYSDWEYRRMMIEITRRGYRTSEPAPLARETSSVWPQVLKSLWRTRITKGDIARDLGLPDQEIEKLLFSYAKRPVSLEAPTRSPQKMRLI